MAEAAQVTDLRNKLGEAIPPGGTESDTLFTDVQLGQWIDSSANIYAAAVSGWEAKLAHWSNLVNVTDGASSRALSDLMENGEKMLNYYSRRASGAPAYNRVRSRIGKIIRSS